MRERIETRLRRLAEDPIPSDAKFIRRDGNDKIFRYRVGHYRALYKIKYGEEVVLVAKIDKRPRIYQDTL